MLDSAHPSWVASYDLSHFALAETDYPHEKTIEACRAASSLAAENVGLLVKDGVLETITTMPSAHMVGPAFANYHILLAKIKKALDPNNVANPTRLINMEKMERAEV